MSETTNKDGAIKRPAFQFYPGDWLRDTALRSCSVSARGLWIEMICLMHEGTPYGHLKVNSKVITPQQLARMVGGEVAEVNGWLEELVEAGVCTRNQEDGALSSRRMIRDEEIRRVRAAGGKEGGNPKLMGGYNKPGFVYAMQRDGGPVRIGTSVDPNKRLYKVKAQYPGAEILVIGRRWVEDMCASEAAIHTMFASKRDGEWFALDQDELKSLLDVHLKVNQTPASASASSSAQSSPDGEDKAGKPAATRKPKAGWMTADQMVEGNPDLSLHTADQYLQHRRDKKATLTQLAWKSIVEEVRKSGRPLDRALPYAMNRGWVGFDIAWIEKPVTNVSPINRKAAMNDAFDAATRLTPHFPGDQNDRDQNLSDDDEVIDVQPIVR